MTTGRGPAASGEPLRRALAGSLWLLLSLTQPACVEPSPVEAADADGAAGDGRSTGGGGEAGHLDAAETWIPPTAWPAEVQQLHVVHDVQVEGELGDGAPIDTTWSYAPVRVCFSVIEAQSHFAGPQVLYALAEPLPELSTLTLELTPDAGVEASIFAYQLPVDTFYVPPHVPTVIECRYSFESGPAGSQTLKLTALDGAYNVLVAVAGPQPGAAGGYTLELVIEGGVPGP